MLRFEGPHRDNVHDPCEVDVEYSYCLEKKITPHRENCNQKQESSEHVVKTVLRNELLTCPHVLVKDTIVVSSFLSIEQVEVCVNFDRDPDWEYHCKDSPQNCHDRIVAIAWIFK
jgi:hypothetical protein